MFLMKENNSMSKESLYIKILVWAFNRHEDGFIEEDLFNELNLSAEQKEWYLKTFRPSHIASDNLIGNLEYINDQHIFTLTAKGTSAAIAYLELQEAKRTAKKANYLAVVSIFIAVAGLGFNSVALYQTQQSLNKAQQSLELNTDPAIALNVKNENANSDELMLPGYSEIKNSKATLILQNNFLGGIKDVDIRMILLEMHTDQKSHYPTTCPFGYIDFTQNPDFIIPNNLQDYSILDNNLHNLKPLEEKIITIDYRNIEQLQNLKNGSYLFTKVDIKFKREIDNKQYQFSKIYKLHTLISHPGKNTNIGTTTRDYLVDTDIAKEIIGYNDKMNEILSKTDLSSPFIIYPFREETFVEAIKSNIVSPYSVNQSECAFFELNKKVKPIE